MPLCQKYPTEQKKMPCNETQDQYRMKTLSYKKVWMQLFLPSPSNCLLAKAQGMYSGLAYGTKARSGTSMVQASLTVEAAFVFPIFLFALLVMMGLFQVLQVECCMSQALQYSARKLAVSCAIKEIEEKNEIGNGEGSRKESTDASGQGSGTAISLLTGKHETVQYLRRHGGWTDVIAGGTAGISFLHSDLSGEYVSLQADYRIRLPVTIFRIRSIPVSQCVRARKWIGATDQSSTYGDRTDGFVYITPYGRVYHESMLCPYLDLSIRAVSISDVKRLRNRDGGKYYACGCSKSGDGSHVYITDYGTEYHGSLSCSHLTRTVQKVEKGEVGTMHACKKCAGGNE